MPFEPTKFYLGVNIGWLNGAYRHDLGRAFKDAWPADPPPDPQYPPSDRRHDQQFAEIMNAYFAHLHFRQIKVVRMWLLEQLEGMTFTGHSFMSPSIGDFFGLDNYATYFEPRIKIIMETATIYRIQIYWCLLDAAGLLSSNYPPNWYRPLIKFLVERARNNLKNDILLPFLNTIAPFQANVFAIDIVNEVDWTWASNGGMLDRSSVASFIHDIYDFIKAQSSFASTASFANYSQLNARSDFNFVDFYDYHRYFDPAATGNVDHGNLPNWSRSKSCIVGEVGHYYTHNPSEAVDETKQAQSSKTIMEQALSRNYSGVLLWRYAPVGDAHRLLKLTKSDTGTLSAPLSNFLQGFIAAAATATSGGQNPFVDYERPIWNDVQVFTSTIPAGRIP